MSEAGDQANTHTIRSILPQGDGHQFVFYGDACSGIPGAPHEASFARTNATIERLSRSPEFIVFAGDEIIGLTTDEDRLRAQWQHWFDVEMAWLDQSAIPLYNTTSNHTTYDVASERIFAEVFDHLPGNGPDDQKRLSYVVRRDDLVLVVVNTCWSGLGGEGHVETDWLDEALAEHADAKFKFVAGHHPVFPVNGFSGEHQREIGRSAGRRFWDLLVEHKVLAYLCSHILAFDVQVHQGVLQVLSAGAGTMHRMPEESEYLHFVQASVDARGLRYQVIDHEGAVRERLAWPAQLAPSEGWLGLFGNSSNFAEAAFDADVDEMIALRFNGRTADDDLGRPQTLVASVPEEGAQPQVWIGLTGSPNRVTVMMSPQPGRSPHYWFGPELARNERFDFQLGLHAGMGPGGIMTRPSDRIGWTSMVAQSPWGFERITRPVAWTIDDYYPTIRSAPFRGSGLSISRGSPLQQ